GKKICALSAIAVPDGFEDTLQRLGANLALSYRYRDHHRYTRREISDMISRCRKEGIDLIITTEKDAVRIPKVDMFDVHMLYLRVEIKLVKGAADFNDFVHNICYY
ncbi:MAG: tetraacyldisaccharide 4'-kinase, partial [Chlamydiota bacterium]|nr:tetraacyldisaccharide 4'-kinase [Chlamydiota bacterium]